MNLRQTWLVARIVLVLLGIFACGVWVGRLTAPQPQPAWSHGKPQQAPGPAPAQRPPLPPGPGAPPAGEGYPPPPPGAGTQNNVAYIVEKYRAELSLTDEQVDALLPAFERSHRLLTAVMEPAKRLEIIAAFHAEISPRLTDEQRQKADAMIEDARNHGDPGAR